MTDMPDTTTTAPESLVAPAEFADDAAGYYTPGDPIRDTKAPSGPLEERWNTRQFEARIANPANRRRLSVIVVGTGLAGASAAATLGEAGYVVKSFCYQDSPRRAHSIAAQGGINAAKNYKGDGDSIYRLFYDTVKGGDFRAREANVYRLAQVSRTFYARGQTGQQLLLGAYQALAEQVGAGRVTLYPRTEMLDLVVKDGRACGIITRNLHTGAIESHNAHAVILATGGYGNAFF